MPIRVFDAQTAEAAVAFLEQVVSPRGPSHWRWKFRLGAEAPPSAFVWEDESGRVVGCIGLMHTVLEHGEQRWPAAWFVDWHVAPGDGAVGIGVGLLRKAEAAAGMLLTLQGSRSTQQILPRLGWKSVPAATTWARPLSARFVAQWAGRQLPAWLRRAGSVAGAAGEVYFRGRPRRADIELLDVDRIESDYDRVWAARGAEWGPAMRRDSAYLNYLAADYPGGGYRVQLVHGRGACVGHLVTRADDNGHGLRRGRIVDAVWPHGDEELGQSLLQAACEQLREAGCDYVDAVSSRPELTALLRRQRFRRRAAVALWHRRLAAGAPDPATWYISYLDCDRAHR